MGNFGNFGTRVVTGKIGANRTIKLDLKGHRHMVIVYVIDVEPATPPGPRLVKTTATWELDDSNSYTVEENYEPSGQGIFGGGFFGRWRECLSLELTVTEGLSEKGVLVVHVGQRLLGPNESGRIVVPEREPR